MRWGGLEELQSSLVSGEEIAEATQPLILGVDGESSQSQSSFESSITFDSTQIIFKGGKILVGLPEQQSSTINISQSKLTVSATVEDLPYVFAGEFLSGSRPPVKFSLNGTVALGNQLSSADESANPSSQQILILDPTTGETRTQSQVGGENTLLSQNALLPRVKSLFSMVVEDGILKLETGEITLKDFFLEWKVDDVFVSGAMDFGEGGLFTFRDVHSQKNIWSS